MREAAWEIRRGEGPLVAAAVHDGGDVRAEVAELLALDVLHRRREEDPHTAFWTEIAPTRILGRRSRFEVDLNRPREKSVYLTPDDAWGLHVWKSSPPPDDLVERSRAIHDGFYAEVREVLQSLVARHGRVVVYDIHSYNHRRGGPDGPLADPTGNPEVNVGTGTMDRRRWGPVVDRFLHDLGSFDFQGRRLDVRENVKFFGGYFPRWIHENFPTSVCAIAIEFKKFFMDEWTGRTDQAMLEEIKRALEATTGGVLEELRKL